MSVLFTVLAFSCYFIIILNISFYFLSVRCINITNNNYFVRSLPVREPQSCDMDETSGGFKGEGGRWRRPSPIGSIFFKKPPFP